MYIASCIYHEIHANAESYVVRVCKEGKETNKQTNILHTHATYCTHKQQLHQLRKIVSRPQ